jgi:hypothetical protein
MSLSSSEYLRATRHPCSSALFVLPLLAIYEIGIWLLGASNADRLRNGADTWLRWLLSRAGLVQSFWTGLLLAIALLAWTWWRRQDRPGDLPGIWMGIVTESAVFALGLWVLSLGLGPLLDSIGVQLQVRPQAEPAMQELVCYLGAGLYEEALFRLLLLSLLVRLFRLGDLPRAAGAVLAIVASAAIFAAAHHIGPAGEPFRGYVFLFRMLAGIYFALLYHLRGFGVAVGAHAGYDVLVGVLLARG